MNLRLRGSESDIIEWDLKPVKVGNLFWKPDTMKKTFNGFKKNKVKVSVPHRVVPIILDLSRICPTGTNQGRYGAGEVSIAIGPRLEINLEVLDSSEIIVEGTERPSILKHGVLLFRQILKKDFGIKIQIKNELQLEHLGLGTTAVLFSCLSLGLNNLLGDFFELSELARFVSNNYCEEFKESEEYVVPGFTTSGAFWSCVNGGINIVSGDFEVAFHEDFPDNINILLGHPSLKKEERIEITSQESKKGFEMNVMDFVRHHDRFDAGKICYWVLMDLIPSVRRKDIKGMGDVVWSTNWNSIKSIPPIIKHGSFEAFQLMSELYFNGTEIVFLSSAGPSIVAISTKLKETNLKDIFEKYSYETLEIGIDNEGVRFT